MVWPTNCDGVAIGQGMVGRNCGQVNRSTAEERKELDDALRVLFTLISWGLLFGATENALKIEEVTWRRSCSLCCADLYLLSRYWYCLSRRLPPRRRWKKWTRWRSKTAGRGLSSGAVRTNPP